MGKGTVWTWRVTNLIVLLASVTGIWAGSKPGSGCGISEPIQFTEGDDIDPSQLTGCTIIESKALTQKLEKAKTKWVWAQWSDCTVSCGGGTKTRQRSCYQNGKLVEDEACSGQSVFSMSCNTHCCAEWASWTECSIGSPVRLKEYLCPGDPDETPIECLKDLLECQEEEFCCESAWTEWTGCSCDLEQPLTRKRKFICTLSADVVPEECAAGSMACEEEESCTENPPPYEGCEAAILINKQDWILSAASTSPAQSHNVDDAVDGNIANDYDFWHSEIASQDVTTFTFFQVELPKLSYIMKVVVEDRRNCCQNRATNSAIYVGNTPMTLSTPVSSNELCFKQGTISNGVYTHNYVCSAILPGIYVILYSDTGEDIHINELEIYVAEEPWTACTVTCGGGTRSKQRKCFQDGQVVSIDACGMEEIAEACNSHCCSDWTQWTGCTCHADDPASRTRQLVCQNGSDETPAECNEDTSQCENEEPCSLYPPSYDSCYPEMLTNREEWSLSASSIYGDRHGPEYAIDGFVNTTNHVYAFHTFLASQAQKSFVYFQIELTHVHYIMRVVVLDRLDGWQHRATRNAIYVGDTRMTLTESVTSNSLCYKQGEVSDGTTLHDYVCTSILPGKFIILYSDSGEDIHINEITVYEAHDFWSECSKTCGGGSKSQDRRCFQNGQAVANENCGELSEIASACNAQCCTEWTAWTGCSCTSNDISAQTRQYICQNSATDTPAECLEENFDCSETELCNVTPDQCEAVALNNKQDWVLYAASTCVAHSFNVEDVVDGNIANDYDFWHSDIATQDVTTSTFFQVELPQLTNIMKVVVEDRRNCCQNRATNSAIYVGNTPMTLSTPVTSNELCFKQGTVSDGVHTHNYICSAILPGIYVILYSDTGEDIHINELEIYEATDP